MNNAFFWLLIVCAALLVVFGCTGCASARSTRDLPAVKGFEASRYLGTWHEIARLPQRFERDLARVTATYRLDGDTLRIRNRGFRDGKGSFDKVNVHPRRIRGCIYFGRSGGGV